MPLLLWAPRQQCCLPPDCGSRLCLFRCATWPGTVCCTTQWRAPSLSLSLPRQVDKPRQFEMGQWVHIFINDASTDGRRLGRGGLPLAGDHCLVGCDVISRALLSRPPAQPGSLLLLLLLQQTGLDRTRRAGRAAASPPSPRAAAGSAQQPMAASLPGSMVRLWAVPPAVMIWSGWRSGLRCTFCSVLFKPGHAVCSCGAWLCVVEGQRCAWGWFNLAAACGATPLSATGDNLADSGTGTALNKDEVHFTAKWVLMPVILLTQLLRALLAPW